MGPRQREEHARRWLPCGQTPLPAQSVFEEKTAVSLSHIEMPTVVTCCCTESPCEDDRRGVEPDAARRRREAAVIVPHGA